MPLTIIRQDISEMKTDAIVNAANPQLMQGGGVCGAIFAKAGPEQMAEACAQIGRCPVGGAVITPGFNLKAKYVIHAVGPVWQGGHQDEEKLLRSAYLCSLKIATSHKLKSIAFPLISAGIYGYPRQQALAIALDEIQRYMMEHELDVTMVLYGHSTAELGLKLQKDLKSYIDDHYVEEHYINRTFAQSQFERMLAPTIAREDRIRGLQEIQIDFPEEETFSQALLNLIDAKGITDVAAYKRSNIDRKLFSKIRSNQAYNPTKRTVMAFTIGLGLSVEEAQDLLARAGYAFSPCHKRDLIVMWFLEKGLYDINEINAALFDFDQELLGP
jgi:O-acetyl-ADP-ribose deacetylase (regulator of RNase III)